MRHHHNNNNEPISTEYRWRKLKHARDCSEAARLARLWIDTEANRNEGIDPQYWCGDQLHWRITHCIQAEYDWLNAIVRRECKATGRTPFQFRVTASLVRSVINAARRYCFVPNSAPMPGQGYYLTPAEFVEELSRLNADERATA